MKATPLEISVGALVLEDGTTIPGTWRIWKDDIGQVVMLQRLA
ncbi:hypothetical protein AU106_gp159 [Sinorhizobium phage phiM9]|uniref:Uncharacterized protein n=1 Tax=Sinorhizobium phage phiM9 TaxID=1636182 RepID=A0A0F6R5Z8_9CAUD|nr:hypothetical protein AU106_gp159 [Sinorhizobium phage phiM9]AKE44790.1 hypothetical protein Sm_phiM9_162 [Sinorhizobium phage phiM9]